jgi:hypothetical protein
MQQNRLCPLSFLNAKLIPVHWVPASFEQVGMPGFPGKRNLERATVHNIKLAYNLGALLFWEAREGLHRFDMNFKDISHDAG